MRVLWVDVDENPWKGADGWQLLSDFGLNVDRVASVAAAETRMKAGAFDLLLVRAELSDAVSFLERARRSFGDKKIIFASSTWSKEQFKSHSKTAGAADRYARVPMPPEGFLSLVADLFGCRVEDFAKIGLNPVSPPRAPVRREGAGDSAVLTDYLKIKEEQLEISELERRELAKENERIQREAQQLQLRLRELEHLHVEVAKKLNSVEEEKALREQEKQRILDERERIEKSAAEKQRHLESQLNEAGEKYENLRTRVRKDIRKIRENERDLEARLELLRRDSSTLLQARDEKVLEMQRKLDALEFDLDQVQDSRVQAQMEAERYLAKLSRVSRALRIAVGMLDAEQGPEDELADLEPLLMGGAATAEELPLATNAPPAPEIVEEQLPPTESAEGAPAATAGDLPDELAALAAEGEPTQMISAEALSEMDGEPESSSG